MSVFISWSGAFSGAVASLLDSWISDVIQGTCTWISQEDIDKGAIWFSDIASQLECTSVGIICVTRENRCAPWILFEAGALSKGLTKNRVCPLLIDCSFGELQPPLNLFNGVQPNKQDMLKLINMINTHATPCPLDEGRVEKSFNQWWPRFETDFQAVVDRFASEVQPEYRSTDEKLDELIEIGRSLHKKVSELYIEQSEYGSGSGYYSQS